MIKALVILSVVVFAAPSSRAAELPEAAAATAAATFADLAHFKPQKPAAVAAESAAKNAAVPVAAKPAQKVTLPKGARSSEAKSLTLRGYVTLSGTGFEPRGSGYLTVTVNGWAQLQDQEGNFLGGNVEFSSTDGYFVSSRMVSGLTHPYALVNVYDGGTLLGMVRVEGSVFVTGFDNGGSLTLSGSGPVEGTLFYTTPDLKKP